MGLVGIGIGAYALYLTIAEQSRAERPGAATRIARAVIGLVALAVGILAVLSAAGVIFANPTPHAAP